jgi:hypothetical protein
MFTIYDSGQVLAAGWLPRLVAPELIDRRLSRLGPDIDWLTAVSAVGEVYK